MNARGIIVPWLFASVVMFGLSYLWHGVILRDIQDLTISLTWYFSLAGVVYAVIGLVLTLAVHQAIMYDWVDLKKAFPMASMLIGAAVGFVFYLIVYIFGMSFADNGLVHVMVDILWQIVEQGIGGLMVSLGIIYDIHRRFMEAEKAG